MSHNGIDIDQYILLVIYPSIAFFLIGFITKKKNVRKSITYIIQSLIVCLFHCVLPSYTPWGGARPFTCTGSVWGHAFGPGEKGKG